MSFKSPRLLLSTLSALLPALCLAAEPAATATQDSATPSVTVSGPTSHVSGGLMSSISSTLPKYQPPPPPQAPKALANPAETEATETMEEIDDPDHPADAGQPGNKIIRLPKYVVEGDRPPIFRDRDLNTKKGLAKIASKKYTSSLDKNVLNRFTLPFIGMTSEQRALMLYEEDERLNNMNDLKQDANNAQRAGDSGEASSIRRETERAYMRSGGMDWTMPKN